jgi:hypothetical protein
MADRAGGPVMSLYGKVGPHKDLEPEAPAKVAQVAKANTGKLAQTTALAGLATLAAQPTENANSPFRSVTALKKAEANKARATPTDTKTARCHHNHDTIQIAKVVKVAMRGSKPGERRGGRQRGTPNKATIAKAAALKAASTDPAIMPLQFLLGVMRDPTAPTDLRIQVARAAAPLVHGKLGAGTTGDPLGRVGAVASEGFTIDIEEAKALRNIRHRLGAVQGRQYGKNGRPLTAAEIAEETELRALISKRSAALVCPPGYGPQDAMDDSNRLHQLNCKRMSPPSCGGGELKGAEDEEEAYLMARVAAFQHSQEGRDRHRITELEVYRRYRSNDEQAELDGLRVVYPKGPESELTIAIKLRLAELQQQSK